MEEVLRELEELKKLEDVKRQKDEATKQLSRVVREIGRKICDYAFNYRVRPRVEDGFYKLMIVGNAGFRHLPPEQMKKILEERAAEPGKKKRKRGYQPTRGYFLLLTVQSAQQNGRPIPYAGRIFQVSANSDAVNEKFRVPPKDNPDLNPMRWPSVPILAFVDDDGDLYVRFYHSAKNINELHIKKDDPEFRDTFEAIQKWPFKPVWMENHMWELDIIPRKLLFQIVNMYPSLIRALIEEVNREATQTLQYLESAKVMLGKVEELLSD